MAIAKRRGHDAASRQASRSIHSPNGIDGPAFFRQRDEQARSDHAPGRVMPAHQRLEAENLARRSGPGLVVQFQLLPRAWPSATRAATRAVRVTARPYRGSKKRIGAARFRLGAIERGIGIGEQDRRLGRRRLG